MSFLQFGQGWSCTCTSARCERRRPFLELDSLTFGRAMAAEFYRRRLFGGGLLALLRLGLARLQRLDPAAHRGQGAPEVGLQLLQLLEGIALRLADDLVGLRLRVLDHLRPMPLRAPQDLMLGRSLLSALVGSRHDARGLCMRLGDDPLLLGHGPVRLLDLVRQVEAQLVYQLHDLVFVDHYLRRQRNVTGVLDQVLEAVKQLVDLYANFSFNALATPAGTRSDTFPP